MHHTFYRVIDAGSLLVYVDIVKHDYLCNKVEVQNCLVRTECLYLLLNQVDCPFVVFLDIVV